MTETRTKTSAPRVGAEHLGTDIVIFGAGGRAGRALVREARSRGHRVTAVVRDPDQHADLAGPDFAGPHLPGGPGVRLLAGDVTDPRAVAAAATGHAVAISAVYRPDIPAESLYVGAARALKDGLTRAGTGRLLVIGIATLAETAPGVRILDAPDFPEPARTFSLGHAAGLEALRSGTPGPDWVMVLPPMEIDYAACARSVLDEIEHPAHHRSVLNLAAPAVGRS
ncbi:NAD(P)H-binding protein [Streptomyces sp. MST-110588]|uniref:NAD(P)-dependent oxidoreductase n=1 Tax=Streptomyces sp. MST-110588 TaxID=2833628 RepID=UPI001F5C7BA2|nr:NAD(P)H-binding protein [Streptomyces sp. MST-110588]UNO41971.1 NAD(P)H-binding protein [Streptomyces sp. MST-110588]